MISACVVTTWRMEEEVWWCWGILPVPLSVIYLAFKAHLTSMATTAFCSDTPSHLVCAKWDYHFSTGQWPNQHTSRLCKGYLTKKESDGVLHQMAWPPQTPDLNPIEMVWDDLDRRVMEKQPTNAQHTVPCESIRPPWTLRPFATFQASNIKI